MSFPTAISQASSQKSSSAWVPGSGTSRIPRISIETLRLLPVRRRSSLRRSIWREAERAPAPPSTRTSSEALGWSARLRHPVRRANDRRKSPEAVRVLRSRRLSPEGVSQSTRPSPPSIHQGESAGTRSGPRRAPCAPRSDQKARTPRAPATPLATRSTGARPAAGASGSARGRARPPHGPFHRK